MGFTLEDIGQQSNFDYTLARLQTYHRDLLQRINGVYEVSKSNIDSHFKSMIQNKRDELSKRPLDGLDEEQNAHSIAEAFTSITNEHARVLQRLRQSLDAFMDREVHSDLQKATHTLSYQHGVRPEIIIDLIVNGSDPKQVSCGP